MTLDPTLVLAVGTPAACAGIALVHTITTRLRARAAQAAEPEDAAPAAAAPRPDADFWRVVAPLTAPPAPLTDAEDRALDHLVRRAADRGLTPAERSTLLRLWERATATPADEL